MNEKIKATDKMITRSACCHKCHIYFKKKHDAFKVLIINASVAMPSQMVEIREMLRDFL